MRRITKLLFAVSDVFAWLLLAFSIAAVVAFPILGPVHARMSGEPLTALGIAGTCILWLLIAAGAFAITRRRVLGLALVLLLAVQWVAAGEVAAGLVIAAAFGVVFGTPFLLAAAGARVKPAPDAAT